MKRFRYALLTWVIGILIVVTAVSQSLWDVNRIDWAYWLSKLAFSLAFIIPGIIMLFTPKTFVLWVQSFGKHKSNNPVQWNQLDLQEKIPLYIVAIIYTVLSLYVLFTILYRLFNACTPLGDCPGLGLGS